MLLGLCLAWIPVIQDAPKLQFTTSGQDGQVFDYNGTASLRTGDEDFQGQLPGKTGTITGKVHAEITVHFTIEPYGDKTVEWSSDCGNICMGQKKVGEEYVDVNHASHEECDTSCDLVHKNFHPEAHLYLGEKGIGVDGWGLDQFAKPLSAAFTKAAKEFANAGVDVSGQLSDLVAQEGKFLADFDEAKKNTRFTYAFEHMTEPCTSGKFLVYSRKVAAFAEITTVYKVEKDGKEIYSAVVGKPEKMQVSMGYPYAVESGVEKSMQCFCVPEKKEEPKTEPPKPKQTSMNFGFESRPFLAIAPDLDYQGAKPLMSFHGDELTIKGQNVMNCTGSVLGSESVTAFLEAGTMLIPDMPGYQPMVVAQDTTMAAIAQAPLGGEKSIPVLCTAMGQAIPNSSVHFAVAANPDGAIRRLAKMSGKGFGRGAIDQVRMWAYTDAASYDEMAKKLLPMVPMGEYLTAVDQVLSGSCADDKREKLDKEFSFARAEDGKLSPSAFRRTMRLEAGRGIDMVAGLVGLAEGWAKNGPVAPGLYAESAGYLGSLGTPEAMDGCHKILTAVPAGFRIRVAMAGGLEPVADQVFSTDKATVERAVGVLATYKSPLYTDVLKFGQDRLAKWK